MEDRRRERQTEVIEERTEGGRDRLNNRGEDRRRETQTELIEERTEGGRDRLN